jgi:hypothetical protein
MFVTHRYLRRLTMHSSTIDARRKITANGAQRLLRVVKKIPLHRLRSLAMGALVLAIGTMFLTGKAQHESTVIFELLLLSFVLLAV